MTENIKAITSVPGWIDLLTADGVPDSNASLYSKVPILFRAVQLRCDAISTVPVKIYRGDETEVPWPYPTKLGNLLWQWEASCLLRGAAYGEIIVNKSGFQKDVRYRNPFDMDVRYDGGALNFRQNSSGATWRNSSAAGVYQMVYITEYDPSQDVLPGVGAGEAANVDAKLLFAISKFPEMYFEGGAMPVTLLGIDSTDKNEISRIENWFKKSATAIKNAFRVLGVRSKSIEPVQLTPLLKDMVFEEISSMSKSNIAVAFGIKQTMLFSEAANYATAQEDRLSFYEDTIKPRARIFADALNEQLLAKDGLRLEFHFNEMDLFQEDESDRADLLNKLVVAGLPVEMALDLAGYKLTDEQVGLLADHQEERAGNLLQSEQVAELRKWQRMAEKRVKEGKPIREFESAVIPASLHGAIDGALENVKTIEEVKRLFDGVIRWQGYP